MDRLRVPPLQNDQQAWGRNVNLRSRPRFLGREIYVDEQVILANSPEETKKGVWGFLSTPAAMILVGGIAWFWLRK